MSNENSPEEMAPKNKTGKGTTLALFAGVFGLAVGAGLYALMGGDDNTEQHAGGCKFDQARQNKLDRAAVGDVAAFKAVDRAYSVASLSFKDVDGNTLSLSAWKGRTVLLNLWATWCAPCRAEMPALDELQSQVGGEKFEVVPISVDLGDNNKPRKFFADIGIKNMRFFHDGELATLNYLKKDGFAYGLPATVLVGPDGCALGVLNGPAEWAGDEAKALIQAAM